MKGAWTIVCLFSVSVLFAQKEPLTGVNDHPEESMDSLSILKKMDSVSTPSERSDQLQQKFDSLINKEIPIKSPDSLREILNETNAKVRQLGRRSIGKVDSLSAYRTAKLEKYRQRLEEKLESSQLSGDPRLKERWQKHFNALDRYGHLDDIDLDINQPNLESLSHNLDENLHQLNKAKTLEGTIPEMKDLDEINGQISPPVEMEKAKDYLHQTRHTDLKNPDQAIDQHATKINEINAFQKEAYSLNHFKKQLEGYQGNSVSMQHKSLVKEQIQSRVEMLGSEYADIYQKKLKEAQKKLTKYKKKYTDLQSLEEAEDKRKNPLHDKPLRERLIPGGSFQIHPGSPVGIDLSPQLTYRITPRWSAGVGGTYRVGINRRGEGIFTRENEMYGGRILTNFQIFKGFFGHSEFERLKYCATDRKLHDDWHNSIFLGLMKKFKISGRFTGNLQGLYNFSYDKESPHQRRWVFRFGFEINPKTKAPKNIDPDNNSSR